MFKVLHRFLVVGYWCFWAAVAFWLYTQRARIQPAVDLATLAWHQDRKAEFPVREFTGTVTRSYGGSSFQVRDAAGQSYNFGLAGIAAGNPEGPANAVERRRSAQVATNLTAWVHGAPVRIQVTLENPATKTGLGIVWAGTNNLNERVLEEGLAALRKDQIRALPLTDQLALVLAERRAKESGTGIWAEARPSE